MANVMRGTAAVAAALVLFAGCAPDLSAPAPAPAQEVRPAGVQDPAVPPNAPTEATDCGDPRESLRPDGPLPPPGAMPAGSTMDRIVRRGTLVVGVNQNAYRVGYRDPETGGLAGFEIDIVRAITSALFGDPNRVRFAAIDAANRETMVKQGQVDLVIRTMTMTCAAHQNVAFSTEYYTAYQRLLVPNTSTVAEIEDLEGGKVCAASGSTSITNIPALNPRVVPVAAPDVIDCLVLLQQHQVDAISTSDILLVALAAQDPNVKVVGRYLKEQPYGVAVAKNAPELVRFVNAVLDRYRTDGAWTGSYAHWLSPVLDAPPPPPRPRYRA